MGFNSTIKKIRLEDLNSLSKGEAEQLLLEAGYYESQKEKVWNFDMDLEDDSEWHYALKTFYFLKDNNGNVVDKKCFSEYIENVFEEPNALDDMGFVRDFAWEEV